MAGLPALQLPIITEHLELRSFTAEDADARFRVHADPAIQEYFEHIPTREDSDRQLAREIRDQGQAGHWTLAVCDRESREIAGICVLQNWNGDCEMVLGLIKQFRCKRLGTELAVAVTEAVFLDRAMERIVGRVAVRNAKSLALVSSLGMTEVGVVRNTHTGKDDVKFELRRPSVPNERCS